MNMSAAGAGAAAAGVNPAMGRAYPPPAVAIASAAPQAAGAVMRGYPVKAEPEQKQVTTEQIQDMLDENSKLIVDVITLNNQIKHGKGTTQLSEFTDKLDKKRKQLNANLMTLAKWADESSEQPPQRPVLSQQQLQQQQQHLYAQQQMQMQYPRAMAMNPMAAGAAIPGQPPMAMNAAQMQAQAQARFAQAQAYAQYQARLNSMGSVVHPQYAQMGPAAVAAAHAQQQQRYHAMGYGNPAMQQPQAQMPMVAPPQMPPQMYDGGASQMGYQGWAPN